MHLSANQIYHTWPFFFQERLEVWVQGDQGRGSPKPRWKRPLHNRVLPQLLCHDGEGGAARQDFQLQSFFNLNKVVALMGAHTFGKPHFEISMFPYTWTRSSLLKYIISSNLIPARGSTCGTTTTTKPSLGDQGYFGKCLVHISWLSVDGSSPLTLAPLVTKWVTPLETSPSE